MLQSSFRVIYEMNPQKAALFRTNGINSFATVAVQKAVFVAKMTRRRWGLSLLKRLMADLRFSKGEKNEKQNAIFSDLTKIIYPTN